MDTKKNILKLTIKERIVFQDILPKQDNLIGMAIKKEFLNKINITPEEISKYNMKFEANNIIWDKDAEKELLILELNKAELVYLKKAAKEYDDKKMVNDTNYTLIQKIMDLVSNE